MKPLNECRLLVKEAHSGLSLVKQCELLALNRSGLYYEPVKESEENLKIMRLG